MRALFVVNIYVFFLSFPRRTHVPFDMFSLLQRARTKRQRVVDDDRSGRCPPPARQVYVFNVLSKTKKYVFLSSCRVGKYEEPSRNASDGVHELAGRPLVRYPYGPCFPPENTFTGNRPPPGSPLNTDVGPTGERSRVPVRPRVRITQALSVSTALKGAIYSNCHFVDTRYTLSEEKTDFPVRPFGRTRIYVHTSEPVIVVGTTRCSESNFEKHAKKLLAQRCY